MPQQEEGERKEDLHSSGQMTLDWTWGIDSKNMENKNFRQKRMDIWHLGTQGQTYSHSAEEAVQTRASLDEISPSPHVKTATVLHYTHLHLVLDTEN